MGYLSIILRIEKFEVLYLVGGFLRRKVCTTSPGLEYLNFTSGGKVIKILTALSHHNSTLIELNGFTLINSQEFFHTEKRRGDSPINPHYLSTSFLTSNLDFD